MRSFSRFIVRATTFLRKELVTVFRQSRLILTFIMGPVLSYDDGFIELIEKHRSRTNA